MLLEEKFLEFHRYVSSHNLPLEAISVGDESKVLCEMHYAANAPRNIYSHTKSFTVTAVGLAIEELEHSATCHVYHYVAVLHPYVHAHVVSAAGH